MANEEVERVSANPGGLDEFRPLNTNDLPMIAEYVKKANKSSSGGSSKKSSGSRTRSSSSRSKGGSSK